jgi:hypothetical protein
MRTVSATEILPLGNSLIRINFIFKIFISKHVVYVTTYSTLFNYTISNSLECIPKYLEKKFPTYYYVITSFSQKEIDKKKYIFIVMS